MKEKFEWSIEAGGGDEAVRIFFAKTWVAASRFISAGFETCLPLQLPNWSDIQWQAARAHGCWRCRSVPYIKVPRSTHRLDGQTVDAWIGA